MQINPICIPRLMPPTISEPTQSGGYSHASADQRLLRTVTTF